MPELTEVQRKARASYPASFFDGTHPEPTIVIRAVEGGYALDLVPRHPAMGFHPGHRFDTPETAREMAEKVNVFGFGIA